MTVVDVADLGSVLADADGDVLYTSDEETADPEVVCTDACVQFWAPLTAEAQPPASGPIADNLGVVSRPDGTQQVTYDGHRLYTFTQDSPGEASGEGFSDTFGGQQFTWHAVVVDAEATGTDPAPPRTSDINELGGY